VTGPDSVSVSGVSENKSPCNRVTRFPYRGILSHPIFACGQRLDPPVKSRQWPQNVDNISRAPGYRPDKPNPAAQSFLAVQVNICLQIHSLRTFRARSRVTCVLMPSYLLVFRVRVWAKLIRLGSNISGSADERHAILLTHLGDPNWSRDVSNFADFVKVAEKR